MAAADTKNRRALGDIGNLVNNVRIVEGKPQQQISRPVTRSFRAQLLANAQAAAAANKKLAAAAVVADDEVKGKAGAKVARQRAAASKPKPKSETVIEISPDTEEGSETKTSTNQKNARNKSSKKKVTLTSVLTARSKVACGIKAIDDIDSADLENQLAVVDYIEDIYKFYRLAEASSQVHGYMGKQTEINERMRSILVDWLIEVHNKFDLMPETLYLTVHIVDQYLSMRDVQRRELQLVGVSAMLIASKYEEIWAPEINDFVSITDMAYAREAILRMEKSILNELGWSLTVPTPYVFLVRFLKAAKSDKEMDHMVFFYAELALMQYSMIKYCPSTIAASAVYAAQCTLKKIPLWSETLRHHTGFTETQIMDCVKLLLSFHSSAAQGNKLKVVYRKYSSPDRDAVALLPPATNLL